MSQNIHNLKAGISFTMSNTDIGGNALKKYSVFVKFKNGAELQFKTDSNVDELHPTVLDNGTKVIITENEYVLNVDWIEEINSKALH